MDRQGARDRASTDFVPERDLPSRFADIPPGNSDRRRSGDVETFPGLRERQENDAFTEESYSIRRQNVSRSELERLLGSRPGADLHRPLDELNIEAVENGRFNERGEPLYDVLQTGITGPDSLRLMRRMGQGRRPHLPSYSPLDALEPRTDFETLGRRNQQFRRGNGPGMVERVARDIAGLGIDLDDTEDERDRMQWVWNEQTDPPRRGRVRLPPTSGPLLPLNRQNLENLTRSTISPPGQVAVSRTSDTSNTPTVRPQQRRGLDNPETFTQESVIYTATSSRTTETSNIHAARRSHREQNSIRGSVDIVGRRSQRRPSTHSSSDYTATSSLTGRSDATTIRPQRQLDSPPQSSTASRSTSSRTTETSSATNSRSHHHPRSRSPHSSRSSNSQAESGTSRASPRATEARSRPGTASQQPSSHSGALSETSSRSSTNTSRQSRRSHRSRPSTTREAAIALERKDCIACLDPHPLDDFPPVTVNCTHPPRICSGCVQDGIASLLTDRLWNRITCMEQGCSEVLSHADVRRLATPETFER
jgi:hypothetical protein